MPATSTTGVHAAVLAFGGVMSCTGRVVVVPGADHDQVSELTYRAVERLRDLESRWSRFLVSSEISRLNAADGRAVRVSADTIELIERLIEAAVVTGGAFDPTMLRPLVELGYATSRTRPDHTTVVADSVASRGSLGQIEIDRPRCLVRLPVGTALDPGGLGKGLAADMVTDEIMRAGATGCLVEVGGDIRVRGHGPGGFAWTLGIDGWPDEAPLLLGAGGVATSSSQRRTWTSDSHTRHHLIDPSTLQPTARGVVECTVAVGSAAIAEALTKVAFVLGLADGIGFYADSGIAARIIDEDGTTVTTPAWRELQRPSGVDR